MERGLLLEVHPSGEKTWRYRYRFGGKRPKITIGRFAHDDAQSGLTLQKARLRLAELERQLLDGLDPLTVVRERENAERAREALGSFQVVAEDWLYVRHIPSNKPRASGSPLQDETYLRRDIIPRIGSFRLDQVKPPDVRRCVDQVKARGHNQAALRVRGVIKRVFDYAAEKGYRGINPAAVVRPATIADRSQRDRALGPEEIPVFLDAVYTSGMSKQLKLALHFLLLVPVRKAELLHAPWTEFDVDAGIWRIPAHRSKTKVPIRHSLPKQAMRLIHQLKEIAGDSEMVFPSNRGRRDRPICKSALNAALRGVKHGLVPVLPHDLRRTVRTGMAELGVDEATAEKCLNHNKTNVYDRSERLEARASALQKWADHVDQLQRAHFLAQTRRDS